MIRPDYVWIFFTIMLGLALAMAMPSQRSAHPRTLYPGQWAGMEPELRDWFRSQKIPHGEKAGSLCCNESDGTFAEEQIINGKYWVRFCTTLATPERPCTLTAWMPVPPDAVLDHPNRHGSPVVWYWFEDGIPKIRCYAPGALT
jgi:hypothetical protein